VVVGAAGAAHRYRVMNVLTSVAQYRDACAETACQRYAVLFEEHEIQGVSGDEDVPQRLPVGTVSPVP
jgi:predicted transcriptional regulator